MTRLSTAGERITAPGGGEDRKNACSLSNHFGTALAHSDTGVGGKMGLVPKQKLWIFGMLLAIATTVVRAEAPPANFTPDQVALLEKAVYLQDKVNMLVSSDPALLALMGGTTLMMTAVASTRWTIGKVISSRVNYKAAENLREAIRVGEQIARQWGASGELLAAKLKPLTQELENDANRLNDHVAAMPAQLLEHLHLRSLDLARLQKVGNRLANLSARHLSAEDKDWIKEFFIRHGNYQQSLATLKSEFTGESNKLVNLSHRLQRIATEGHSSVYEVYVDTPILRLEEQRDSDDLRSAFGHLSFTGDAGGIRVLSKPTHLLNETSAPSGWCRGVLAKLKVHESKHSYKAKMDGLLALSTLGLGGAGVALYQMGKAGVNARHGASPQQILTQQKEQARTAEIRQFIREQEIDNQPTTLAQKLASRRTVEKDPELLALYNILRKLLRNNMASLSAPLRTKATLEQLNKAEFYSRLGKFHGDDDFANTIIDAVLSEVALDNEFKVSDAEHVEQLMWAAGLVRPDRTQRFMMLTFAGFSKHLWPKYGIKADDYGIKDPTIVQKLVDSYLNEVGALASKAEIERQADEKAKTGTTDEKPSLTINLPVRAAITGTPIAGNP